MNNLNSVLIEGNLAREPELRYTPQGTPTCTLVLASNRTYKDPERQGERTEEVSFIETTTWGKLATVCAEHLAQGARHPRRRAPEAGALGGYRRRQRAGQGRRDCRAGRVPAAPARKRAAGGTCGNHCRALNRPTLTPYR